MVISFLWIIDYIFPAFASSFEGNYFLSFIILFFLHFRLKKKQKKKNTCANKTHTLIYTNNQPSLDRAVHQQLFAAVMAIVDLFPHDY